MPTKHTCNGPTFGRLTPGCPRCDELAAGAAPRRWHGARRETAAEREAFRRDLREAMAKAERDGIPCTFGEW